MLGIRATVGACGATRFNMGITEEGIDAEQWLLKHFRDKNIQVFQPDAISLEGEEYVINEIKNQEMFDSPPFDGHGLPKWQVKARMKFYEKTKIRCRFIVKEKNTNIVYHQWLDVLEKGEFFDTKGEKPRRIYNINLFNKREK